MLTCSYSVPRTHPPRPQLARWAAGKVISYSKILALLPQTFFNPNSLTLLNAFTDMQPGMGVLKQVSLYLWLLPLLSLLSLLQLLLLLFILLFILPSFSSWLSCQRRRFHHRFLGIVNPVFSLFFFLFFIGLGWVPPTSDLRRSAFLGLLGL